MEPADGTPLPGAGEPPTPDRSSAPFRGLRHKTIYRVVLGYAVGAWLVLQVAAIVLPGLGLPGWVMRPIIVALLAGFGAALLAGWTLDRRAAGKHLLPAQTGRRAGFVAAALLPAVMTAAFFLVHDRPAAPRPAAPAVAADVAAPDKSLAVLPFDNFGDDKDGAVFAEGVQDEVLTDLAKVADLKVISRSSVLQYKNAAQRNLREIGKVLDVAYVVEGSVQRAGHQIRVTAQLIDTRTDAHRWAERYDRDLADVFAIQSEIAQAIAGQLQAAISPQTHAAMTEAPTRDLPAYELYLRARALFGNPSGGDPHAWVDQLASLLTEATRRDPDFARAYAFLAEVQAIAYAELDPTPARAALVRNAVEAVTRLRPGSADAHEATGAYAFLIENDYARAHDEFTQTVRLAPNDAKSFHLLASTDRFQALWDDSLVHYRKALELDPGDVIAPLDYVQTLQALGRYPEALAVLDRLVAAHPHEAAVSPRVQIFKARLLLAWKADVGGARAALTNLPASYDPVGHATQVRLLLDHCARDFAAADRDLAACPLPEIGGGPRALQEGYNARYRGDPAAAEKAFLAARPPVEAKVNAAPADADSLMILATIDAALGRKAEALSEGRRAAAMHPLDRDAWIGPYQAADLAVVLAWTGEREEAIRLVQTLGAHPNGPSYGYLKLHPDWDSLRGDGRFEAVVASLAPKP